MDWSTSALINDSPLARRLPGQRTPPDPAIEQPNAADLTYGWHSASSSSDEDGDSGDGVQSTSRQQEAASALRQRRRQQRGERRRSPSEAESSSEGSVASYNSATGSGAGEPLTGLEDERVAGTGTKERFEKEETPPRAGGDPSADVDADGFICRICFDGPGSQDEGGETLGRLIAPCRCRGTMKFVHQACLTRWRAASMRQSSIVACDQCGSPYKFRKSRFVGLATNRALVLLVSCLLFISLIWTVGYTAESMVRRWEDPVQSQTGSNDRIWQSMFGEEKEGEGGGYDEDDNIYSYDYAYFSSFYWEPLSYVKLVKAAVKHVGSGRATRAVKDLIQGDAKPEEEDSDAGREELGWAATLVDDWKYGSGGLWEGQRPDPVQSPSTADKVGEQSGEEGEGSPAPAPIERERYDAKTATPLRPGERHPREEKGGAGQGSSEGGQGGKGGWCDRIALQFSLGFSLVGIFSFINLLLGISFWGPFHLGNFGLGRSFARLTGTGRRRGGGGDGADGGTIASVILLFLVIVGILRALMAVISLTTYLSKRLLTRVEDYIVEYSGEEERMGGGARDAAPTADEAPRAGRQRRWWERGR